MYTANILFLELVENRQQVQELIDSDAQFVARPLVIAELQDNFDIDDHESRLWRLNPILFADVLENLFALRFANIFFSPIWNRESITKVTLSAVMTKEAEETSSIQEQVMIKLMSILSVMCMERPVSLSAADVQFERVRILKSVSALDPKQSVKVNGDQLELTFKVKNERWDGVDFVMNLTTKDVTNPSTRLSIVFDKVPGNLMDAFHNELIMDLEPQPRIRMGIVINNPGTPQDKVKTKMDMALMHGQYCPLQGWAKGLQRVLVNDRRCFMSSGEMKQLHRIFTSIKHLLP